MNKAIVFSEVDIEIPFFDVDLMEIVWHGHYIKYFEIARCALLNKIEYDYMKMRESGYTWPVIDIRVRYARPATFGQTITVQVGIIEWENRLKMNYQIVDKKTHDRLSKGYTCQVAVDTSSGEMCYESPSVLWEKLGLKKK